jgi:predicted acyl esterase
MIVERDLPIPMDDGLVLRADVFRPPGAGPFPVIMSLGPYGKSLPFSSVWFAARWERLLADHPEIAEGSSCAHMNWETVSQGWLRLSHRAVDPARSRPWRPWHPHQAAEPVRRGQVYPVAVEMWPTCVVLPARYRLALTVAGRDFARPDASQDGFRGSGPFAHHDPADRPAARAADVVRVHTGARTPSSLLLPVIP